MTAEAASDLPELLAPVMLRVALRNGASAELPSRVCDVEGDGEGPRLVVHRPDVSALAEPGRFPPAGEELELQWVRPRGRVRMPVVASAGRRPYGPVWELTPLGPPTLEQRREYFRVPLTLPAVLTPVVDGARLREAAVLATLVEIGEGGAVVCHDAGLPDPGTVVELSFNLHDRTVMADAEVLRREEQPAGPPRAALRFLDPTAYGDHIRRAAFDVERTRARARSKPT